MLALYYIHGLLSDILPESVPRILINRERLQYIRGFDVRLLGYGDTIVKELCSRLGGDWAESVGGVTPTGTYIVISNSCVMLSVVLLLHAVLIKR